MPTSSTVFPKVLAIPAARPTGAGCRSSLQVSSHRGAPQYARDEIQRRGVERKTTRRDSHTELRLEFARKESRGGRHACLWIEWNCRQPQPSACSFTRYHRGPQRVGWKRAFLTKSLLPNRYDFLYRAFRHPTRHRISILPPAAH